MQNCSVDIPAGSDFTLDNVPFGVFSQKTETASQARCATRIGDTVVDLAKLESMGFFSKPLFAALKETGVTVFNKTTLNAFMELTREHWREVRATVQEKFRADCNAFIPNEAKVPLSEVNMHLPARIGDYTDFYSSKNHAFNVGCMFRGPEQALKANWTYLPVGYHGRSSSVVVSGTDIRRPHGQTLPTPTDTVPVFGASKRCDFELEMGKKFLKFI